MAFEQRLIPPLPVRIQLAATVRETGLHSTVRGTYPEIAVARVDFYDPMGESWTLDFTPEVAMDLLRHLAAFIAQVGCQGRG